jgi:hypothetical protein
VHRAFVLLNEWGLTGGEAGHRAKVVTALDPPTGDASEDHEMDIRDSRELISIFVVV